MEWDPSPSPGGVRNLMIPGICSLARKKGKYKERVRWHRNRRWLPPFGVCDCHFAHIHHAITVQSGHRGTRKSPGRQGGGADGGSVGSTPEWGRRWSSPPPHFSCDDKPLARPLLSHTSVLHSLINPSFHRILSVRSQKNLQHSPKFQNTLCSFSLEIGKLSRTCRSVTTSV